MHAAHLQKKPPLQWRRSEPTAAELAALEHEATAPSAQFDSTNLKGTTWNEHRAGRLRLTVHECGLARIVALHAPEQSVPLEEWGRVFQWFGSPAAGGKWTVYWYANPTRRQFPAAGQPLGPEHVNGGYTQPCSANGIFIYRAEEATRVLVHELMHATCLDEPHWDVPEREALIETWAELVLVALVSAGDVAVATYLWYMQSHWIADTNLRARLYHGVKGRGEYAWRYLCGREQMYARLGIQIPNGRSVSGAASVSTRFTHPCLGP